MRESGVRQIPLSARRDSISEDANSGRGSQDEVGARRYRPGPRPWPHCALMVLIEYGLKCIHDRQEASDQFRASYVPTLMANESLEHFSIIIPCLETKCSPTPSRCSTPSDIEASATPVRFEMFCAQLRDVWRRKDQQLAKECVSKYCACLWRVQHVEASRRNAQAARPNRDFRTSDAAAAGVKVSHYNNILKNRHF